ncbi:MAG: membrane integrity-associated transporter subunit PqiC [Parvularculaceae bacterium]|nr:membrane integrity-associated transporter subunit PqiC [Parvularculaceae bacterium]
MRTILIIAGALALSACISVLPDAPPASARFQVTDVTFDAAPVQPAAWSLSIEEPMATRAYDTANIALSRAPAQIEYYAGGEWVDRAPRLFGAALVRSFENAGAIRNVGAFSTVPLGDFALQTDIRRFGAVFDGGRVDAKVEVFARLTNGRGKVYASRMFTASNDAGGDQPGAVARALNAGATQVQREIVAWTLEEANAAYAK